ncbi:MAG: hypothetical protein MAGBODY4_00494 [Candidatus Marinimicrobia bacterium]|nr:hypothetical protein [Candidatus Neomarinimicrobiota bacterium]
MRLKVIDDDGFAHRTVLRIHVERGTHIVGGEVAGRWTAPESPFFIDGDVTIPAGDTLIIDPGVQVVFTGQYAFSVSGYLSAFGWGDSTITFAPEDSTGWWGGLRFLESPDTSELRQCIIERGSAIGTEPYDRGGGIYIQGANPRITHSIIRENRASMYGGGIYCEDASPYIGNCTVEANSVFYGSSGAGGGIYTINSTPNILGSQIIDNTVGLSGGFSTADGSGGGVYLENSDAILPYNLIAGNSVEVSGNVGSSAQGGGISALQSDLEVINNTISGNITTINGIADTGSVLYLSGSYPKIFNSILWGNSSSRIKIADANADSLLIAFSDIEGGQDSIDAEGEFTLFWEQGNISENPLFIDPGNGNYHLAEGSPCINNGTSWFEWEGELLLFIPSMNYAGPAPDMGAFESDVIDAIDTRTTAPQSLELFQNYPNPFNPETIITYGLPRKMSVQLTIYDLAGHTVRELVSEYQQAGWHHIRWNGRDKYGRSVSTGVYLYRLRAGEYEKIRKMMYVK